MPADRSNSIPRPAKRKRLVARFRRDERGATAVEFGLIAVPFFALMFAILETALVFFSGQALETAVGNVSRLVRTGQAQQDSLTADAFKEAICDQVYRLFDCAGGLHVDVRTYPTFAAMTMTPPMDDEGNLDPEDFTYNIGARESIVVVRAYYEYPVYVTGLGNDLRNLGNGKHLVAAAAAFRNEPFPW